MSGLYPTPTRLALLRDVDAGRVQLDTTVGAGGASYLIDSRTRVTSRVDEIAAAGWVHLNESPTWELTALGRDVLAGNGGGRRA